MQWSVLWTIVFVCFSSFGVPAQSDLQGLLRDYRARQGFLMNPTDEQASEERRAFMQAIQSALEHRGANATSFDYRRGQEALADLHAASGDHVAASDLYEEVAMRENSPQFQIRLLEKAAVSAGRNGALSRSVMLLEKRRDVAGVAMNMNVPYAEKMAEAWAQSDLTIAQAVMDAALQLPVESGIHAEAIEIAWEHYNRFFSDDNLAAITFLDHQDVARAQLRAAEELASVGSTMESQGIGAARASHAYAAAMFESFFERAPEALENESAIAMYLREKYFAIDSSSAFREFAGEWMQDVPPNNATPQFLFLLGMELSNSATTRVASNDVFALLQDMEEAWFPDSYTRHPNFQWAVLRSAENYLELGDLEKAEELLAIASELPIAPGSSTENKLRRVRSRYDTFVARGYDNKRVPDDTNEGKANASDLERQTGEQSTEHASFSQGNQSSAAGASTVPSTETLLKQRANENADTSFPYLYWAIGGIAVIAMALTFILRRAFRTV